MSGLFSRDADTQADIELLPDDTRSLYDVLEHDGAEWRRSTESDIAHLNARLQATAQRLSEGATSDRPAAIAVMKEPARPQRGIVSMRPLPYRAGDRQAKGPGTRARALAPAFVAVAVVLAFVTVFALGSVRRGDALTHGTSDTHGIAGAASATPVAAPRWVEMKALDSNPSFSANDLPAIAPSDPRVVYQTFAMGIQQGKPASLRRTDDGGAHWQELPTPVAATHIGWAGIGVSPLDAHVAFLSVFDTVASDCPANRAQSSQGGFDSVYCRLEFTTTDGGAHWSPTQLPLANGSTPGLLTTSHTSLHAQGTTLFDLYTCAIDSITCSRLVASDDGGRTWHFVDQALQAGGDEIVHDYTVSPSGKQVYAVTAPAQAFFKDQASFTLWSSADGAKTWSKVGQLATPNERGIVLPQNATTGAATLYLALPRTIKVSKDKMGGPMPLFSSDPQDIQASVDGGRTWTNAPSAGIPAGHTLYMMAQGFMGTLSDGSVVVDVIPVGTETAVSPDNFSGSGLYAWKLGDSAWRPLGGDLPREMGDLLVTHDDQADTLYATLVNRNGGPYGASLYPTDTFVIWSEQVSAG